MIRTRWQDIPAPPEAKVVQMDPEDESGAEEDEESREAA
jgi:hypothetical protein